MAGPTSMILPRHNPRKPERIYVNLGRTGDAIASLPLAYLYFKETGKKCGMMVAREFAGIFEGVSYIEPEIWGGDWKDWMGARARCQQLGYRDIFISQIYGWYMAQPHTESSFMLDSWKKVGKLEYFDKVPLVFDKRDFAREAALASKLPMDKPVVLVACDGFSAPFPHKDALLADLKEFVGDRAHVLDMAPFKATKFFDLLGLIDSAAVLVTGDTGIGQLAVASNTPIIALAATKPTTWYSAPQRKCHAAYIRYDDYQSRKGEIMAIVEREIAKKPPTLRLVYSGFNMTPEAQERHRIASQTWAVEAATIPAYRQIMIEEGDLKRSAETHAGEKVALPFVNDMLDIASQGAQPNDVLLLTNSDISFVPGLFKEVMARCKGQGATYCHRWDFPKVVTHVGRDFVKSKGRWYVGCDLFAMTVAWWDQNKSKMPPMLLGRECWDWVMRELIKETGGIEIEHAIYHEKHPSAWALNRNLSGNLWNRGHAREFLNHRKIPLAEIADQPFLPISWKATT